MKKTILALTMAAASTGAAADTVLGVYAGGGQWMASYSGGAGSESASMDELNLDETDNIFYFVALEHPVPLIPNVRIAHTNIQVDGVSTLESRFTLDDRTYERGTEIYTELDMTHTDGTLYYEILDNWVSFDIGLTARAFDGYVYVRDENNSEREEEVELSEVVPLIYAKAQFELPMTGWRFSAAGNFINYSGDSFSDVDAKFGYMTDGFVLDFGIDVGYRRMNLDVTGSDDLQADLTIAGPYVEASVHF